jgi:hypothetical protein
MVMYIESISSGLFYWTLLGALSQNLFIRCLCLVFAQRLMHDVAPNIKGMIKYQALLGWGHSQK